MLRCPKCSRIYQSGTNRFCTHDGGRLIVVAETDLAEENLSLSTDFGISQNDAHSEWRPRRQTGRLVLPPLIEPAKNGFAAHELKTHDSAAVKTESSNGLHHISPPISTAPDRRPTGRLVLPTEIPDSFAPTGDRAINPTGRLAITPENTAALIGQNVKGRYAVDKVLQQDVSTVTYLAHDRLGEYRQVLIKIWLDDFPPEADSTRRFYEERAALSHLNHPNIARILDIGDLTEGKPFIITEFPEGLTLREAMQISGQFTPGRTARIVRQVAHALTEAHNNRLTHRNLKPENIVLKNDGTLEQVKVLNFGIAGEENGTINSLSYLAPENLINGLAHIEGDIYALGVVAYEMLTGRKPFAGETGDELLDAQELGLAIKPTNLRLDLSSTVDAVIERALAYSRADRFHHANEFGESLFNALTESVIYKSIEKTHVSPESTAEIIAGNGAPNNFINPAQADVQEVQPNVEATQEIEFVKIDPTAKTTADRAGNSSNKVKWLIAAAFLIAFTGLIAAFLINRNLSKSASENSNAFQAGTVLPKTEPINAAVEQSPQELVEQTDDSIEQITAIPQNFVRFENSKTNLNRKLAEKFVPFSLAYPQNWKFQGKPEKPRAANFLDVSNRNNKGLPLEQLLVSWYESRGTFEADRGAFPALVKKLTASYAKEIPVFRKISEGETSINGRPGYEVKFTGETEDAEGKNIRIFGRTIFVPVGSKDQASGLLLTMLATNLSQTISSPQDVGEKGELKEILSTFELKPLVQ